MAVAARKTGHDDRHVVAVIGDGAMSGGLAFEGLNNVSSTPNDLLIILNDNDMSIDRAVGGMEKYLLNLDTNATYNKISHLCQFEQSLAKHVLILGRLVGRIAHDALAGLGIKS